MSVRARLAALRRGSSAPSVVATDSRDSVVSSAVDLFPRPSDELIRLALAAAGRAHELDLSEVADRCSPEIAEWVRLWPGEHYRLLAGLVDVLQPRLVVEIGTFQGQGSLALQHRLPIGSRLVTFDVVAWDHVPHCALAASDFVPGRFEQILDDLSDPAAFARHADLLHQADLIFMDAPKDGRFEPAFLKLALPLFEGRRRVLVIDDVRLMPMVQLWRDLPLPKLDVTSFGHWSGTGLAFTQ